MSYCGHWSEENESLFVTIIITITIATKLLAVSFLQILLFTYFFISPLFLPITDTVDELLWPLVREKMKILGEVVEGVEHDEMVFHTEEVGICVWV